MELTNILGKIKSDKELPKPFLALAITNDLVQAAVWQVKESKTEIVSLGSPVEWQLQDKESALIQAVDATISNSFEGLDLEPNQIVFGLPYSWTNKEGIEPDKLNLIKLISHELELKPLGFVVIIDSLIRYLKMQEGTPSTSLLIQVGHDNLTVNLVELGKVKGTQTVGRSEDIALDVQEAITRLQVTDNLPSRLIVFDGLHNLEEITQNLVSYDWQSKFKFLHLPKVESLPKDIIIRSVAIAGGAEVAKSIGFEITPQLPPPPTPLPKKTLEPVTIDLDSPELVPATDFGFGDVFESASPAKALPTPAPTLPTPAPVKIKTSKKFTLPTFPKLPKLTLPSFGGRLGIFAISTFLLIALIGSAVWFVPHAKVTIYITPKNLEQVIPLTLSTNSSTIDVNTNTIPASLLETNVTGEDSIGTTGTKIVGDPASGEVTIYNRTNLVKQFPAGTSISSAGLDFSLEEDVTVASSSAGADYTNIPGKATVKITAEKIGEESNLKENSEFTIGNFSLSNYIARNESSLSGGSSREIKVVSQQDIDSLIDSLTNKLFTQAKDQLLDKSGNTFGLYLLEDSLEITTESYSAKLGEETDMLEVSLEVTISGISYHLADIETLVSSAIDQAIPQGYLRTSELPRVELSSAQRESDQEVIADAKVNIQLLPDFSTSSLQLALRGLSTSKVESTLSSIVGLDSAHVEITPKFIPPRLKSMPRNPSNISITTQATE